MTEKEFKADMIWSAWGANGPEMYRAEWTLASQRALAKAKEAGAKFDPEPVELPELASYAAEPEGHLYVPHRPGALTPLEAAEVVRRCNAWPQIGEEIRRRGDSLIDGSCDPTGVGKALRILAGMEFHR